ncbi:MAG: tyrosine-type recombinase/integrase [Gulosibacter sp.]|uniref:tyrosine-type recombinase/integrase n=1 Tax=Gulosibacter sp. TaxID=2817531 RepID=UPI003F8FC35D
MNLHNHLDHYLAQRRALGFRLTMNEYRLRQFLAWLDRTHPAESFTIEHAIAWARNQPDLLPSTQSQRLSAVRQFANWLHANDLDAPIIPTRLLPIGTTRRTPYIYSQADLDRLLEACATCFPHPRVTITMHTIIGLLAATGLRIGETLRLTVPDLDTTEHMLLVRATKTPRDRLVPLDPTTTQTLLRYLRHPARQATSPSATGPIFVNHRGSQFVSETIEQHFAALTESLSLTPPGQRRPRLHDLRHTFATRHMIAAYTHDRNPARTLTLLTTWLGHTDPAHTYWYLTAVPELLAAAAGRLDHEQSQS